MCRSFGTLKSMNILPPIRTVNALNVALNHLAALLNISCTKHHVLSGNGNINVYVRIQDYELSLPF